MKETLKQKLEYLKKQQDDHTRLAVERKVFLRNRKIRFFGKSPFLLFFLFCCLSPKFTTLFLELERRKIERSIRRLEKLQRTSSAPVDVAEQLCKLKEDLEYVRVN